MLICPSEASLPHPLKKRLGLQKVQYWWWLESRQEQRWGTWTMGSTTCSLYHSEEQTIQFPDEHILWGSHWYYGVMGFLTAILQNAEHPFQVWSFSWLHSVKQLEKENREERKVHNKTSKSYLISSLCFVSCSKQCIQLKNSSPFLLNLSVFELSTSYQSQAFKRKEKYPKPCA